MVRLQRVTVLALHNYLGLTNELFSHVSLTRTHAWIHTHTHTATTVHQTVMQTSVADVVWHLSTILHH